MDGLKSSTLQRGDPGWPDQLEHLDDPPTQLWIDGDRRVLGQFDRAVAVVGSRRATLVGLDIARGLARELADAGVLTVSGMARGIDGAAHQGALTAGSTAAVLGCGVDICYPSQHVGLRRAILDSGLVMSEDPPGTAPQGWRFPRRNRLIAALVQAVVVVEADERSGALSTARWARDLGREVLAVPGSIRSDRSRGTNQLIRDGVRPLLNIADLFEEVPGLIGESGGGPFRPAMRPDAPDAGGPQFGAAVLAQLAGGPAHQDDLARALHLGAGALAATIGILELHGEVATRPGGLVERRGRW